MSDVDLSGGTPEGALSPGEVKTLQTYTKDTIERQAMAGIRSAWGGAKDNFFLNVVSGIGQALLAGISGAVNSIGSWASSIFGAGKQIHDGQLDIAKQNDLLSPLLDCIHLIGATNGGNTAMHGSGFYPFTVPLAPYQGVEIRPDGGVTLLEKGWWTFDVQLTVDWIIIGTSSEYRVETFRPDGTLYSRKTYRGWITDGVTTYTLPGAVCVPDTGYYIRVWVNSGSGNRGWLGGSEWSAMIVQHVSRKFDKNFDNGTGPSSVLEEPITEEPATEEPQ